MFKHKMIPTNQYESKLMVRAHYSDILLTREALLFWTPGRHVDTVRLHKDSFRSRQVSCHEPSFLLAAWSCCQLGEENRGQSLAASASDSGNLGYATAVKAYGALVSSLLGENGEDAQLLLTAGSGLRGGGGSLMGKYMRRIEETYGGRMKEEETRECG